MLPAFLGARNDDVVAETNLTKSLFPSYQNKICVSWCPQMCWRHHGGASSGGEGGGLSASAGPLHLGNVKKSPNMWRMTSPGNRLTSIQVRGHQFPSTPWCLGQEGAFRVAGLPTASGWWAQLRERSLLRDPWGPVRFSHLTPGEIYCTPGAPEPWGLWLSQEWANWVHFVWNFLQERQIWKKFRNFQNSGNFKCWPTVRNSHTIHGNAVLTIFPFVSIIPPREGGIIIWRTDYTSHITDTFFVSVGNQRPVILSLSAHPIMVTNRSHQIIILLITLNNASRYKLPH